MNAEWKKLSKRHHQLVDKKFSDGLTVDEAKELAEINRQMDDLEEPYYKPIYDLLERLLNLARNR